MSVGHQSIRNIRREDEQVTVEVGILELTANWRCAASLAEKEGLIGTAARLRYDADTFDLITRTLRSEGNTTFTIEVDVR